MTKIGSVVGALVMGMAVLPAAALADDPHDPAMRNAAARAADRAIVKRLNQDQLSYVGRRDADSMRTYHVLQSERDTSYADARADYGRQMAAWRQAVAACNAGRWEYCRN